MSLLFVGSEPLATVHGDLRAHVFHDEARGHPALALTLGDLAAPEPLPARVHSSCITSEAYGGCDCDCAEQMDAALAHIVRGGRGVLFYLIQEGRGAGFTAKARDRMLVQASGNRLTTFEAYDRLGLPHDQRTYGEVPAVCAHLGITAPLLVLTNNPDKVATLATSGVPIAGTLPLARPPSPFSRHYLGAKARAGHRLAAVDDGQPAALPEQVEAVTPAPLAGAPRFVRVASYLLPIRLGAPAWFRVHVYFDVATGSERVVLTHRRPGRTVAPLVRVQRDALRERFPLRAPVLRRQWGKAARRIVANEAGAVVFSPARAFALPPADEPDLGGAALLAAHVGAGRARVLHDKGDVDGDTLTAALTARGVALQPRAPLEAGG